MKQNDEAQESRESESGFVYMLRCADDTLYTGWTTDIVKRYRAHNSGRAAKYTRSRRPAELVYLERVSGKGRGLSREANIKKLPREKKLELIDSASNIASEYAELL